MLACHSDKLDRRERTGAAALNKRQWNLCEVGFESPSYLVTGRLLPPAARRIRHIETAANLGKPVAAQAELLAEPSHRRFPNQCVQLLPGDDFLIRHKFV